MKKVVVYDSYVFSQLGIVKLLTDCLPEANVYTSSSKASIESITHRNAINLVIVSVWDYQNIEEIIKSIECNTKVVIYYEYLAPIASLKHQYTNVVGLISKKVEVDEFGENITKLLKFNEAENCMPAEDVAYLHNNIYNSFYE